MAGTSAPLSQTEYRPGNSQRPPFRRRPECCMVADATCHLRKFLASKNVRDATEPAAAECGRLLSVRFSLEPRPKQCASGESAQAGCLFACKRLDPGGGRRSAELSGDERV